MGAGSRRPVAPPPVERVVSSWREVEEEFMLVEEESQSEATGGASGSSRLAWTLAMRSALELDCVGGRGC